MTTQPPQIRVDDPGVGFVALVTITVDGPRTQARLVDMLSADVHEWVRFCPGFISANYHLSRDGRTVINYAQWSDEDSYRASFDRNPDKARMREAIQSLPGVQAGPVLTPLTLTLSVGAPTTRADRSR